MKRLYNYMIHTDVIQWSKEIILGINFLHKNKIVHCNINTQ
jgi:serine/threonine protein kinase